MIPNNQEILTVEFEESFDDSINYKMHLDQREVRGLCDEKEAMIQVIYKILNTERYEYIIYSWDYGIELKDLFGMPVSYVCPELIDRIREALIQDDRIEDVTNFDFDLSKKRVVKVSFTAETIFGDVNIEREVQI